MTPSSLVRNRPRRESWSERLERQIQLRAMSWPVRERLYRHLAVQLENGVTWLEALRVYQLRMKRHDRKSLADLAGQVIRAVKDGQSLSAALGPWLPHDEALMIASGEEAGELPAILEKIIVAKTQLKSVRRAVLGACTTPLVYLLALYGLIWGIGEFFVPSIADAVPRDKITGLGASLYTLGDAAANPLAVLPLLLIAGAIALIFWSLPRWTGALRAEADRYFPFSFYRDIQGYLWLLGFSTLLAAGQPDVKILRDQARRGAPWLRERVAAIQRRMENGASLPDALRRAGFDFPNPEMIDDIESMAAFRDFPVKIAKIADQWAKELEWKTLARVKSIGLVFDLLTYGLMGYVLSAINDMSSQFGNLPIH